MRSVEKDAFLKFNQVAESLIGKRTDTFKVIRSGVDYTLELIQLSDVLAVEQLPIFKLVVTATRIVFDSIELFRIKTSCNSCLQDRLFIQAKIRKWEVRGGEIEKVSWGDQQALISLRDRHLGKIQRLQVTANALTGRDSRRIASLSTQVDAISAAISRSDVRELGNLAQDLAEKRQRKIEHWNELLTKKEAESTKHAFDIAITASNLAISSFSLIAAVYLTANYGLAIVTIKIVAQLAVRSLGLWKYRWWSSVENEDQTEVAIRSFEQVGGGIAKALRSAGITAFEPYLIKGGVTSWFAGQSILASYSEYRDNGLSLATSGFQIQKLDAKLARLSQAKSRILSNDHGEAVIELMQQRSRYQEKASRLTETLFSLEQALNSPADLHNRQEIETNFRLFELKVRKYNFYLARIAAAINTMDIRERRAVTEVICDSRAETLANWKLNEEYHAQRNLTTKMRIIVSVGEIATFAIFGLTLALSRAGIKTGVPLLTAAGVLANASYVGYFVVKSRAEKKIDEIRASWCVG